MCDTCICCERGKDTTVKDKTIHVPVHVLVCQISIVHVHVCLFFILSNIIT